MEAVVPGIDLSDRNQALQFLNKFTWPEREKVYPWNACPQAEQEWMAQTLTNLYLLALPRAQGSPPASFANFEGDLRENTIKGTIAYLKPVFEELQWEVRASWDRAHSKLKGHIMWSETNPYLKPRPALPRYEPAPASMEQTMWSLAAQGQLTDFTYFIGPNAGAAVKIPVHRAVLAAQSNYFKNFFLDPTLDPQAKEDIFKHTQDPTLFKDLLYFIYNHEPSERSILKQTNVEYCLSLYRLAHCTEMEGLKALCRQWLDKALDSSNLQDINAVAELYGDAALLVACSWYERTHAIKV